MGSVYRKHPTRRVRFIIQFTLAASLLLKLLHRRVPASIAQPQPLAGLAAAPLPSKLAMVRLRLPLNPSVCAPSPRKPAPLAQLKSAQQALGTCKAP